MMTEKDAYGDRDHTTRALTKYEPGDRVTVGPGYRAGGLYAADGCEGNYTVVKAIGRNDYKVSRGDAVGSWDLMVCASRLTPR